MAHDQLLAYLSQKIEEGYNLSQISLQDGKNRGYYSDLLKRLKIRLPDSIIQKLNGLNKASKIKSNTKLFDIELVKKLITEGNSSPQIGDIFSVSSLTVIKNVKKYLPDYHQMLKDNGIKRQSQSMLGKTNPRWKARKGKTYEEIYGPEKAIVMRGLRSDWLKNNNIRKFATRISKPQAMLFEIVKNYFPTAIIEHDIKLPNGRIIWLDIAIKEKKICIEYDGIYWHKINQNNTRVAVKDDERDRTLKEMGWTVYRIQCEKNPSKEELIKMFLALECTNG